MFIGSNTLHTGRSLGLPRMPVNFTMHNGAWCMDVLEESYTMVVSLLQPEVACEVYSSLRQLLATSEAENEDVRIYSSDVRVFTDRVWVK